MPQEPVIGVPWLLPTLEAAILGVLVFGHPADLARHRRWLHPTAVTLATLMVAAALWATVRLIDDLIQDHEHKHRSGGGPTRLVNGTGSTPSTSAAGIGSASEESTPER